MLPEDVGERAVEIEPAVTGFLCPTRPYFGELVAILVIGMLVEYAGTLCQQLHPGLRVQTPFHHGESADIKHCAVEDWMVRDEQTDCTNSDS